MDKIKKKSIRVKRNIIVAVQLFTFILCSNYCLLINLSITYNLLVNLIYIMKNYFILFALSVWMTGLSTNAHGREIPDFFWMKKVGAMSYPVQQADTIQYHVQ